jgi:uncharacterized protein YgbK (DUF1537 family)
MKRTSIQKSHNLLYTHDTALGWVSNKNEPNRKVKSDIPEKTMLKARDIYPRANVRGGVIILGPHVQRTPAQLQNLLAMPRVKGLNLDVTSMDEIRISLSAGLIASQVNDNIMNEITSIIYTSRLPILTPKSKSEKNADNVVMISNFIVNLVKEIHLQPKFMIVAGFLTASEIEMKALGIKNAIKLGQIMNEVLVWRCDAQSRFPGMPYIIFHGDTGDENAIVAVVQILDGFPWT